jgi:hypothetical protein
MSEIVTNERLQIIQHVQAYCANLLEQGSWSETDGAAIAEMLNADADPMGLFRFIDEKTGDWRVGYRTRDGREWFPVLRQMRNTPESGLLEGLEMKR